MVPKLEPQVICDAGMMTYMLNHSNHQAVPDIAKRYEMTLEDYSLSVGELAKKYPPPEELSP